MIFAVFFYLGFNTNPKNGRVKALSKACLDWTYFKRYFFWVFYYKSFNLTFIYLDTCAFFLRLYDTMNNEQISCAYLETLAFKDLVKLADEYGVDVPQDLDRRFLIAELLELAQEESNVSDVQMIITDDDEEETEEVNLPANYNETQIGAILRNPAWLFVFWNISEFDANRIKHQKETLYLKINTYKKSENSMITDSFEVQVLDESQEQYVLLPKGIDFVKVELLACKTNSQETMAVSSEIKVPRISSWINELNFAKDNLFSNKLKFSGMEDLLMEQYKNHRHSFM